MRSDHRRGRCVVRAQQRRPRHPLRHLVRCHPDRARLAASSSPRPLEILLARSYPTHRRTRTRCARTVAARPSDRSERVGDPPPGPSWRVVSRAYAPSSVRRGVRLTAPPLIGGHRSPRGLIHDAVGGGIRDVDGAGSRAHRWGSPRRGIYRADAHTVSRRGVATTQSPGPRPTPGARPRSPTRHRDRTGSRSAPGRRCRLAEKPTSRRVDRLVSRVPEDPHLCASVRRCLPSPPLWTSPCVSDIGQDTPFVNMSDSTSGVCRSVWLQRDTELVARSPLRGSCVSDVGRVDPSYSSSLASIHSLYTPSGTAPQPVHTTVLPPLETQS